MQEIGERSCGGRCGQQCTYLHVSVFLITFISYALYHASRKTISNVKSSLLGVWSSNHSLYPNEVPMYSPVTKALSDPVPISSSVSNRGPSSADIMCCWF